MAIAEIEFAYEQLHTEKCSRSDCGGGGGRDKAQPINTSEELAR